ncbi:hypothetical protein [Bacillus sp. FJAT-22090]|uniref:ADP-ribosyltransferase-containing protein n=1 Tax=Bacillus sp. FJAT-22090 TaxID=1581038 RepID=UPI0011A06FFF|nr:hypothetical protein [Bacillus sp. FJAT-22090]
MELYHGSKSKFNRFDLSFIGLNGTSEGKGFYFTNNYNIAKGYAGNGYLYTIDFHGKKALGYTDKRITENEYRQLVKELDRKGEYLSNFGDVAWDGIEKVTNEAVEIDYYGTDNDADLIGSITNAYGNSEDVLNTVYTLLGYDHIIIKEASWGNQTIVVALTNDCFNIVSIDEIN